jgi:hypothetical protein
MLLPTGLISEVVIMLVFDGYLFAGGAFYFKRRLPARYEQAGRLINEGL